jgi:GntR family transcriptional regulator, transcriptional repressor for pyruvate dehydrogenase complex
MDEVGSLTDRVYARIAETLARGDFARDTRLPGEIEMARGYGVSRPVLRQALARLRAEGRLYARKGSGHYVGDVAPLPALPAFGALDGIADVRSFLEFRAVLEGESAALAAHRRDPDALRHLQHARERFDDAIRASASGVEEDLRFHAAVAQASGNRFYEITLATLAEQTRVAIRIARDLSGRPLPERLADVQREHALVETAIRAGHADAARQAMTGHLRGGLSRLFGK